MTEDFTDLHFPLAGIDLSGGYGFQRPRALPYDPQTYSRSTRDATNVRGFAPDRARGGSRPGLGKYLPAAVVANWVVLELNAVPLQLSQSGRVVYLVAVSQGNVYTATAGATAWTAAVNGTGNNPPLNFSGTVLSAPNGPYLYFADGTNWCRFNARTNTVEPWVASAGALPVDNLNNTPRLICTWRGRTVLSGLLRDPANWFMSAVDDPTDFDYAPALVTPTQAVAGNNAPQGLVGDVITSLCPYSDDVLIFFGMNSIYTMSGDPMAGGQLDRVTDTIGGTWGVCWTKDPYGTVYFCSNKMGVYTMVPGQQPQRISQGVEQLLQDVDTGANGIRLAWDDRFQGCHVFITPLDGPAATTHLFYEQRTGAWWKQRFANNNHNPLAMCLFDGNLPGDRSLLLGSWDGYVRRFDAAAADDDGTPIASEVVLGPILTKDMDEVMLKEVQAVLGETSGAVTFAVYTGATAEVALNQSAAFAGTFRSGRNLTELVKRSGHAIYVKLSATTPWAMEQVRCLVRMLGAIRRRGY